MGEENGKIELIKDTATNKERLKNLENYVGSINKNVKNLDAKVDNLNIQFVKLSTEIKTERQEHEKVLSMRIWLISLLISGGISGIGIAIKVFR